MKWDKCKGSYNAFISLGSTCQTAYQLRRLNLRRFSGPLDWFTSHSTPDLTRLLKLGFKGFIDWHNLQLIGTAQDHFIIRDSAYQVDSYHDFPISSILRDVYPKFLEKTNRRVARFLNTIHRHPVCFVRTQTTRSEAYSLEKVLSQVAHKKHRLLIINHHQYPTKDIIHEDWGFQHVGSVTIPSGRDWRGSDQEWGNIMKGFRVL